MMGGYGMGGGGLLGLLIIGLLVIVPFWRLLPRFGIPNWVAIFTIVPFVALILLWVMAFKDKIDGGRA
ncbi:hypothetical protein M8756_02660 [Lutimaribacter sp. EGI FJ00015]|uniref:Uncharacterized protein n=1 Tax=Lutimaribacter degradans TaxID=2945989 RepID=A0ACC5ZR99_9RHOB|nr:hypothetical protein [Lutimaribacter sp. EGI FJ00013]MCM2560858.1 hypothetical protein [Lutimaribacter sp. EGI FJ00013]MCO0612197.1 hypothetical protein [Lutimaribacter sp. EGI FJ00015]MCO0634683.1 hypothetical protein [Lutimaribacter sp. EGI FJ00014]